MRYPPDRPCPLRATRCLISPPPRSASIRPLSARSMASRKLLSAIPSRRTNRANHFVLKSALLPDNINYSTLNYSSKRERRPELVLGAGIRAGASVRLAWVTAVNNASVSASAFMKTLDQEPWCPGAACLMRSKADASIRLRRGCRLLPFEAVGRANWARKGGSSAPRILLVIKRAGYRDGSSHPPRRISVALHRACAELRPGIH